MLSAEEAAARLGIKRETLYAYVSRGLLTSTRGPGRTSAFDADEVAALAARARRGGRAGGLELIVASGLTSIEDDRLTYRGINVADLVPGVPFEAVANGLWTGCFDERAAEAPWPVVKLGQVPVSARMIDRLRIIVALASAGDELRSDLSLPGIVSSAKRLLAAMVDQGRRPVGKYIAGRLLPHLGSTDERLVTVVNAILVLLADHELAASTLAARAAASVRADPYSVVSTGLGVIAGPLHGAASKPVVSLLAEIGDVKRVERVIGERLGRNEYIPGLGHKVYRRVDPRAEILFEQLRPFRVRRWEVVEATLELFAARLPLVVNIDFALGAFVWAFDLDVDASEMLFSVARSAGWVAHAIEEYGEPPVRFRPRAVYTGPRLSI